MTIRERPFSAYMIQDLPELERPRERLLNQGAEHASINDLLAILIRNGRPGRSTIDLARDLMQHFNGDLRQLAEADPAEYTAIKGIGMAKAAELKACFEIARRVSVAYYADQPLVNSPESVATFFRNKLQGKEQEELHCLLLSTKHRVIRSQMITTGLLNSSLGHPREIFRPAIRHGAACVVLAHNHPSGDPTPSRADINLTN